MTSSVFLKPDQQLAEAIEPRKTSLDNPSSCLEFRILSLQFYFLASPFDMRDVLSLDALRHCRFSSIALVCAKVLPSSYRGLRSLDYDVVQGVRQQLHVVLLGSADDEGQRDSTAVDENASLAPIFFPDLSGCDRLLREQVALCLNRHRYFAIARQYPPSRRIRQDRPSIISRKSPPSAIQGSSGVLHWDCRNVLSAPPSTVCRCVIHTQSRQKRFVAGLVFALLLGREGICVVAHAFYRVSEALPSPRTHQRSPTNAIDEHMFFPWKKYHLWQRYV
jgi:hypothetical protein